VHLGIHFAQKMNGFDVLAPAVLVRQPFARLSRVIEIDHRSDGIDTQAVDMEFVDPVQRIGDQEVAHFVAAEIENQCAPVLMLAATRVGVLIHGLPGKARQRPVVFREVRRHPVEQHADAGLVAGIDKGAKFVRRTETRGRRVIA